MRKSLILVMIVAIMIFLASCGSSQTEEPSDTNNETIVTQTEPESEPEPSPLEGKWTDEAGITELVVEGNDAVLNGMSVGTAYGETLDFPNDYETTETKLIDGKLYLTFTPFDSVIEEAGLPENYTVTVELSKVEE